LVRRGFGSNYVYSEHGGDQIHLNFAKQLIEPNPTDLTKLNLELELNNDVEPRGPSDLALTQNSISVKTTGGISAPRRSKKERKHQDKNTM